MEFATPPVVLRDAAPALTRHLGLILAGLVDLIARRFLRDPTCVVLLVPLCLRLRRAMGRFERAVTRPVAVPVGMRVAMRVAM